ncbi:MAG: hypothetical protein H0T52_06125 [Lautropia sp.]|nr:hypothetical protein [Lautropia sp.]
MTFTALGIDDLPLDQDLTDDATVGPDLAQGAHAYLSTPRALIWRNPSSDWQLLIVLLPLATRLSLMTNPIFGRLVRDWGMGIRFIGVDAEQSVYDFRELLDRSALAKLVTALARVIEPSPATGAAGSADHPALDTLFSVLADDMLTILQERRDDWRRHLAREDRLMIDRIGTDQALGGRSLFDRRSRFPEFIAQLRQALRLQLIDIEFYGRVLRSIDLREDSIESRVLSIIEGALDPITLAKLTRTRIGAHLGCYNWLRLEPRTASHRASVLHKLPLLAQFLADKLVCGPAPNRRAEFAAHVAAQVPGQESGLAARTAAAGAYRLDEVNLRLLVRAIDSGQDRWVVEALARYFRVSDNVIRALWRACPAALGAPPEWHLRQILLALNERPERSWPSDAAGWLALKSSAIPASVGSL